MLVHNTECRVELHFGVVAFQYSPSTNLGIDGTMIRLHEFGAVNDNFRQHLSCTATLVVDGVLGTRRLMIKLPISRNSLNCCRPRFLMEPLLYRDGDMTPASNTLLPTKKARVSSPATHVAVVAGAPKLTGGAHMVSTCP
jgi:hypothetical protein